MAPSDNAEALAAYKARITNRPIDRQLERAKYDKNYRRDRYEADVARANAQMENIEFSPVGLAKDLWNATGGNLIGMTKSIKHTFEGKNALGKNGYLNFGKGGPRWNRRLGGVTIDALNAFTLGEAGAFGANIPERIREANAGVRNATAIEAALPEQLNTIRSTYAQRLAANDQAIGERIFPDAQSVRIPEWKVNNNVQPGESGLMRVWHTNMNGEPLPYPLSPIEDVGGFQTGRRGAGGDQLISQGMYATNNGNISSNYGREVEGSLYEITHSYMPPSLSNITGSGVRIGGNNAVTNAADDIANSWKNSLVNQPHTLDMTIGELSAPQKIVTPHNGGFVGPSPTTSTSWMERVMDSVHPESASYITEYNLRPGSSSKTIFDLINDAPNETIAKDIARSWPHSLAYRPKNPGSIKFKWNVVGKAGELKSVNTAAADFDNPYFLNIKGVGGDLRKFHPTFEQYNDLTAKAKAFDEAIAKSRGLTLDEYIRSGETEMNPYQWGGGRGSFDSKGRTNVSQNYWDIPVSRNAEGALSVNDGFKSFDFGNASQADIDTFTELYTSNFQKLTGKPLTDIASNLLESLNTPQKGLTNAQMNEYKQRILIKLGSILNEGTNRSLITPKEKFYELLKQKGYNSIPHLGGLATGGEEHQAFNFLRPEALPPSTFVKGGRDYIQELLGKRYGILSSQASEYGSVTAAATAARNLADQQVAAVHQQIRRAATPVTRRLATQPFINTLDR